MILRSCGKKHLRQLVLRAENKPEEACAVLGRLWTRWAAYKFERSIMGDSAESVLAVIDRSADIAMVNCGCLCEGAMEILARDHIRACRTALFEVY